MDVFAGIGVTLRATDVEIAHRTGRPLQNRNRSIIIRLTSLKAKQSVMKSRAKLKGRGIVIVEDLTLDNAQLFTKVRCLSFVTQAWTLNGNVFGKGQSGQITKVEHEFDLETLRRNLSEQSRRTEQLPHQQDSREPRPTVGNNSGSGAHSELQIKNRRENQVSETGPMTETQRQAHQFQTAVEIHHAASPSHPSVWNDNPLTSTPANRNETK